MSTEQTPVATNSFKLLEEEEILKLADPELREYALQSIKYLNQKKQQQQARYTKYKQAIQLHRKEKSALCALERSQAKLNQIREEIRQYEESRKQARANTIQSARETQAAESDEDIEISCIEGLEEEELEGSK